MRITDFKRFFLLQEFWASRHEFVDLVEAHVNTFFDTADEVKLWKNIVLPWLVDNVELEKMFNYEDSKITFVNGQSFPCGRINFDDFETKYKGTLTLRSFLGLTALYFLLGANDEGSDIPLEYEVFAAVKSGRSIGGYRLCYKSLSFNPSSIPTKFPLERQVLINANEHLPITIASGDDGITLQANECVVGIFDAEGNCYKLLPNKVTDEEHKITLRIIPDKRTYHPMMKKETTAGVEKLSEVYSIGIESGGFPVYLTGDGVLHFDRNCYRLSQAYTRNYNDLRTTDLIGFSVMTQFQYEFIERERIKM